ncbi:DUF2065 domain-containing protein [Glycocaulis profundi]|nr:DUF2065 domain-containing protein [Glycocaulis profundi]
MGLAFALEGALYAIAPESMKRFAAMVAMEQPGRLRTAGLFAAALGVGLVWLGRAL